MTKFTANNNKLAQTKLFLFFASRDLYSYMSFNIVDFFENQHLQQIHK